MSTVLIPMSIDKLTYVPSSIESHGIDFSIDHEQMSNKGNSSIPLFKTRKSMEKIKSG